MFTHQQRRVCAPTSTRCNQGIVQRKSVYYLAFMLWSRKRKCVISDFLSFDANLHQTFQINIHSLTHRRQLTLSLASRSRALSISTITLTMSQTTGPTPASLYEKIQTNKPYFGCVCLCLWDQSPTIDLNLRWVQNISATKAVYVYCIVCMYCNACELHPEADWLVEAARQEHFEVVSHVQVANNPAVPG